MSNGERPTLLALSQAGSAFDIRHSRFGIAMKLIVGLGNPGKEYERTRHNAGFMVVTRLAKRLGLAAANAKMKFHAATLEGTLAGDKALLMLPQTFMNRSGLSVGEAAAFYKVAVEDVLVVVDDVALPAGRLRLRAEGSAGGHNGLTDIERALGTKAYPRLRIGVDAPGRVPQRDYVLQRFSPEQVLKLEPLLDIACDAVEMWAGQGIAKAMSTYNADAAG